MTNTNTASGAAMQLADQYAAAHAKWALEDLYGTSKSYTAKMLKERHALRSHLAAALATAAAPAQQPNTAYAALPAECDSPELCAVSRSCAGQFGTKRICTSRGQAPAGAASVTDAMVLAALQVQYPAGYDTQLRHPANGPKTSARTEAEIDLARRMIAAALATHSAPAAQAPSVLEDAARYRHIRDVPHSEEVRSVLIHQQNAVMDRVIDKDRAAMAAKKGDAHE